MPDVTAILDRTGVPADRERETLDARDLPPPRPLRDTLERLAALGDDVALIQFNDRRPRHLYPRLDDRGYRHETVEDGETVVTAIWADPDADRSAATGDDSTAGDDVPTGDDGTKRTGGR
jgi:hypothetical protein